MRKLAAVTGIGAVLAMGGYAHARFSAGEYRGETRAERPLSFTASKRAAKEFRIRVRYDCTDFDRFWTTDKGFPAIRIRSGRFAGTFKNADGSYTATIRGTLDRRKAEGVYTAERHYTASGRLDPDGRVTCKVAKLLWTAKRR